MKSPVINARVKHVLAIIGALFNGIMTVLFFELMANSGQWPIAFILVTILCALTTYLCTDYALVLRDTLIAAGEIKVEDAAAKRMRLKKKKTDSAAPVSTPDKKRKDVRAGSSNQPKPVGKPPVTAAVENVREPEPADQKTEGEETK